MIVNLTILKSVLSYTAYGIICLDKDLSLNSYHQPSDYFDRRRRKKVQEKVYVRCKISDVQKVDIILLLLESGGGVHAFVWCRTYLGANLFSSGLQ